MNILDDQSQASLRREVQVYTNGTSHITLDKRIHQVLWELRSAGGNHTLHLVDYFEQGAQVPLASQISWFYFQKSPQRADISTVKLYLVDYFHGLFDFPKFFVYVGVQLIRV